MKRRALALLLLALLPCGSLRAIERPQVVPSGQESAGPYAVTGMLSTYEGYGSGVVAAHPRVLLSCAHVAFSLGYYSWTSGVEFFRSWNQGSEPPYGTGDVLSGYYYWRSYASAAAATERLYAAGRNTLAAEAREFNQDFVAYFHHSKDLAGGDYARVIEGAGLLANGKYQKIITGYPMGIYDTNPVVVCPMESARIYPPDCVLPPPEEAHPDEFRMHSTVFTGALWPEKKSAPNYLTAYDLAETGSGNSGGPVWVDSGGLAVAGVLVSGQEQLYYDQSMIGVHAISRDGLRLVESAMNAADSSAPAVQSFEVEGGVIPDYWTLVRRVRVSGLPKTVMSVTLDIEIEHPYRGEVTISVRAPGRKAAVVYDGLFDESEEMTIKLTGEQVAYFYGAKANGIWTILVDDWEPGGEGRVVSARLNISAR